MMYSRIIPLPCEEEKTVTQLVGAICEDGKKVITVSDRMVSSGDMTLAWEQPREKAIQLTDKAVVLTAGTVHEPDLLRKARDRAKGREVILEVAEILQEVYQEVREKTVVDTVLRPKAGIKSFDEWHEKQAKLHFSIIEEIQHGITQCHIGSSLLLAGMDTEGHLIMIEDPGRYRSWDLMSFCCMGMGDRHADNVFAWY
jgi:20S proteasome alpha/beta subunit